MELKMFGVGPKTNVDPEILNLAERLKGLATVEGLVQLNETEISRIKDFLDQEVPKTQLDPVERAKEPTYLKIQGAKLCLPTKWAQKIGLPPELSSKSGITQEWSVKLGLTTELSERFVKLVRAAFTAHYDCHAYHNFDDQQTSAEYHDEMLERFKKINPQFEKCYVEVPAEWYEALKKV